MEKAALITSLSGHIQYLSVFILTLLSIRNNFLLGNVRRVFQLAEIPEQLLKQNQPL